jgi:antitoxin component YwqK of YwqJK toxin-antitoxin module
MRTERVSRRLLLLTSALAGCGVRAAPPARIAPPAAEGGVVLVEPGRAPRQTLSYSPKVGAVQAVTLELGDGAETENGVKREGPRPQVRWDAAIVVRQIEPGGVIFFEGLLGNFSADGKPHVVLGSQGKIGSDGRTLEYQEGFSEKETAVHPPLGKMAAMIARLPSHVMHFPREPVGLGARWRETTMRDTDGGPVSTTAEYELARLEGRQGTVTVRMAMIPGKAPVTSPRGNIIADQFFEVEGRMEFDLEELVATEDLAVRMGLSMSKPGSTPTRSVMNLRMVARKVGAEPLLATAASPLAPEAEERLVFLDPCQRLDEAIDGPFDSGTVPGRARSQGRCVRGKPDGRWRSYHPGGQLELEGEWRGGLPHGIWTQWSATGARLGTFILADGTGPAALRWPGGGPRVQTELRGGKLHGAFRSWHEDGAPFREGRYQDGLRAGPWIARGVDGRTSTEQFDPGCAIVERVLPASPAEQAGLQRGDRMVEAANIPLDRPGALAEQVKKAGARSLVVTVIRAGKRLTLEIRPQIVGEGRRPVVGVQLGCRAEGP